MAKVALLAVVLALVAAGPGRAAVPLQPCPVGGVVARCGTVAVPENRALPAGPTISLNVEVLPAATPTPRSDPLFYVTGGPGGAATAELPSFATAFASVVAHRDVVFVDQRGVGGSNPLRCAVPGPGFTGTLADFESTCLLSVHADLTHYRTPDAMDDLDAVRQALGYGQIDLYGVSYGATAVQVYLRRHPDTVRAVVLDGATLLDVPVFERWASNGQRALDLLARRCTADRACRRAFPTWQRRFPALLAALAAKPRPVRVAARSFTLDAALTADTVETLTASAVTAAEVPFVLARAEAGNLVPLARWAALTLAPPGQPIALMPPAIMCTEPWAVQDPARVEADARGTYLAYSVPETARAWQQICAGWPKVDTSAEDWSRVASPVPALVLVGGADPKDPIGNIAGIRGVMPNAGLVTVPGQGHGVGSLGCLPTLIDRFLERGSAAGLDTSCARLTPLPSFRLH